MKENTKNLDKIIDKKKSKFYIKDKKIFSDKYEEIFITEKYDSILPDENENLIEDRKIIYNFLNNNKKIKKIKTFGLIKNYEKILNIIKTNNIKIEKIQENEKYDFIEKTSQIEILEQIINNYDMHDLILIKKELEKRLNKKANEEEKKIKEIRDNLNKNKNELEKESSKKRNFEKENINILEKNIIEEEKKIEKLFKKKNELEEVFIEKEENVQIEKELIKLKEKEDRNKYLIEESKLQIEILKAKLNQVEDKIKMGETKCLSLVSMFLSLGLIYWSKYSDCKNLKFRLKNRISKENEKNLYREKKILKISNEIKLKHYNLKIKNSQFIKIQEKSQEKLNEIDKQINKSKKIIETQREKLKENKIKLEKITKLIDNLKEKIEKIEKINSEFERYSKEKIETLFKEIWEKKSTNINQIKTIVSDLKKQKVPIEKEGIIQI
jgi:hypothetical protein